MVNMAAFHCDQCGRCCISLGRHISIERKLSSTSHYCRVAVTREVIPVTIHPEYRDLFLNPPPDSTDKSWCPYLRRISDGEFVCTIYPNRPSICRNFSCYSMRILDREGVEVGRVSKGRDLKTNNAELSAKWESEVIPLGASDGRSWQRKILGILEKEGYTVEIVD
jgi:Fe-S-cluster containining protein